MLTLWIHEARAALANEPLISLVEAEVPLGHLLRIARGIDDTRLAFAPPLVSLLAGGTFQRITQSIPDLGFELDDNSRVYYASSKPHRHGVDAVMVYREDGDVPCYVVVRFNAGPNHVKVSFKEDDLVGLRETGEAKSQRRLTLMKDAPSLAISSTETEEAAKARALIREDVEKLVAEAKAQIPTGPRLVP